jgi:hypothetical protein
MELFPEVSMRERIATINPEAQTADGLDDALIGVDSFNCAVYSVPKILGILMTRDGMDYEEAMDFFSFNIERGCHGDYAPVYVYLGDDV